MCVVQPLNRPVFHASIVWLKSFRFALILYFKWLILTIPFRNGFWRRKVENIYKVNRNSDERMMATNQPPNTMKIHTKISMNENHFWATLANSHPPKNPRIPSNRIDHTERWKSNELSWVAVDEKNICSQNHHCTVDTEVAIRHERTLLFI